MVILLATYILLGISAEMLYRLAEPLLIIALYLSGSLLLPVLPVFL
ncbi:MAG TPA: hypothetical protein VNL13_00145 [Sulfolobales archaeon]|nr:hypothetical protein [Sulfolobales archaeon]